MQGIFQKENTDKALKYGIYRHLPTYEKIIRNLVSFYLKNLEPTVKNFCFQIPIFINQKDNTTAIEETSKLIYSNLFDKQLSPSHSYTIKYNINRMVFEIDIH